MCSNSGLMHCLRSDTVVKTCDDAGDPILTWVLNQDHMRDHHVVMSGEALETQGRSHRERLDVEGLARPDGCDLPMRHNHRGAEQGVEEIHEVVPTCDRPSMLRMTHEGTLPSHANAF